MLRWIKRLINVSGMQSMPQNQQSENQTLREMLLRKNYEANKNRTGAANQQHDLKARIDPPTPETVPVTTISSAMRSMMDRPFVQSQKYKDQQMRAEKIGAHPDILEFERRLLTRMRKQDVPLFTLCLWRGQSEQNAAYVQGHSKARFGQSAHNYGMAADIIHCVHGYNLDRLAWGLLGHIGKEISVQSGIEITWGGDWSFWDPAHWELAKWRTMKNWNQQE